MKIIQVKDYKEMSNKAAAILAAQVALKEDSVLGLATGSTMVGPYEQLRKINEKGYVDFSKVRSVNLDEYVGLPASDVNSYIYFMETNLFKYINILPENANLPNGRAEELEKECKRYEDLIKRLGGIDLQLLGLGHNGHIGFNEPDEKFVKETHVVNLKESTICANSRFFDDPDQVPKRQ